MVYANNSRNLNLALRRLTATREPERPGFEAELRRSQSATISEFKDEFAEIAKMYEPFFEDYKGIVAEEQEHYADPHIKRDLRIQAHEEISQENQPLGVAPVIWAVTVKMKPREYAKPGKKPRCIGDLGVAASLQGFRLTWHLKMAQSAVEVRHKGGVAIFIKSPNPFDLKRAFELLINPEGRATFVYFSDDSCLSIYGGTKYDYYNLDLKSCDSSHTDDLFTLLEDMVPGGLTKDDMKILTAQCALPLRIICRENPKLKVKLATVGRILFSGSTITTAINNLANLLIFMCIMECEYSPAVDARGENVSINQAANKAGYVLTGTTSFSDPEHFQFLKNSPVRDTTGEWQPMLNFGVLLRAMGTCHGDLPGRGPLRPRAEAFTRGLLQGCYPFTDCAVLDAMRRAAGSGPAVLDRETTLSLSFKVEVDAKYPRYRVDEASFALRYGLEAFEMADLCYVVGNLGFGEHYSGRCVDKILRLDYGVTTTENIDQLYTNASHDCDGETAILR